MRIRVIAKQGSYWKYTIVEWIKEVKEILEQEYGITLEVVEEDCKDELPEVWVDDVFSFKGVPGEEGYLIELLKISIEERLRKNEDKNENRSIS